MRRDHHLVSRGQVQSVSEITQDRRQEEVFFFKKKRHTRFLVSSLATGVALLVIGLLIFRREFVAAKTVRSAPESHDRLL